LARRVVPPLGREDALTLAGQAGGCYDTCTNAEKAEWIQRYLESHEETTSDASKPVSVAKRTSVTLDVWGETVTSDAWWFGNFWNSWVVPLFTEEDMTLLCERTEFFRDHLDGTFTVDPENEVLDMRETLTGEMFDIGGERVKLYAPSGLHFKLADQPMEFPEIKDTSSSTRITWCRPSMSCATAGSLACRVCAIC
jgi:hypothetical protein